MSAVNAKRREDVLSTDPRSEPPRGTCMPLMKQPHVADPDGLHAAIIEAHTDLSETESAALNARLVLLLANHIGSADIVREALTTARKSLGK